MSHTLTEEAPQFPQELSHEEAKTLYENAESIMLTIHMNPRAFIVGRWMLGQYFAKAQQAESDWSTWLKAHWPKISSETANLWIDFSKRTPWESLAGSDLEELKAIFLTGMVREA